MSVRRLLAWLLLFSLPAQAETLTVTVAGTGTVNSSPVPGIVACASGGGDCTEVYTLNTEVALVPTPGSGQRFTAWSGDADCSNLLRSELGFAGGWGRLSDNTDASIATDSGVGWAQFHYTITGANGANNDVLTLIASAVAEGVRIHVQFFYSNPDNFAAYICSGSAGGAQDGNYCFPERDNSSPPADTSGLMDVATYCTGGTCTKTLLSNATAAALLAAGNQSVASNLTTMNTDITTALTEIATADGGRTLHFSFWNEIDNSGTPDWYATWEDMGPMFVSAQTAIKAVRANAKVATIEFSSGFIQCASGVAVTNTAGQCGTNLKNWSVRFLRHRLRCPVCTLGSNAGEECGSTAQGDPDCTVGGGTCGNSCTPDWVSFHVYGCEVDIQEHFDVIIDGMVGGIAASADLVAPIAVTETAPGDPRPVGCNDTLIQGDNAALDTFAFENMGSWIEAMEQVTTQKSFMTQWLHNVDEDPDRCNDNATPTLGTPCTAEATCDALGNYDCSVRSGVFSSMGAMFKRTAIPVSGDRTSSDKTQKPVWANVNQQFNHWGRGNTAYVTVDSNFGCTATFGTWPTTTDWDGGWE